ncbi:MAG TPA: diaminopropionate ammonia-lyase, partial [Alphaproteobacteria bacterium]|nr:diaminopropionate ammonia-lyase [Alphaproteobacteria bacterium]
MVIVQGKGLQVYRNSRALRGEATYPPTLEDVLSAHEAMMARTEIGAWPGYAATPLVEFPELARALGIAWLWYKDESGRFGLKSFKALGGAYAVLRQVQARVAQVSGTRPSAQELIDGRHRDIAQTIT